MSVLAHAYGVTGAAAAYVLTVALATVAIVTLQSWTRRSFERTQRRTAADALRSRLVRNMRYLLALSPEAPAWRSPSESSERHL